ncbi:hypothetical protein JCM19238_5142 [Vibrio ponticus]|nr:hypothetical protein JCM19238_5142 [Vibrio ponticus]
MHKLFPLNWGAKVLVLGACFAQSAWASNNNCANFTALFEQRDFVKIESMFKRAALELGYPNSSIYLNKHYAKTPKQQVAEIRRVYRGCYSLKKQNELLVNLLH